MIDEKGTALYLQVEQALKDFQTGVARLKSQQAETEELLAKGDAALETLVRQVTAVELVEREVQSCLDQLEKQGRALAEENDRFADWVEDQLGQARQSLEKVAQGLRTEMHFRRRELEGTVTDHLGRAGARMDGLERDLLALAASVRGLKELENKICLLEAWAGRQRTLERRQKYLAWAYALLLTLFLAAQLF
jgi:DNA repair exonuclease SbcCD ATPase subunit